MAKTEIEGPAGYNGGKGPSSSDLKLPTKHYASSTKMATQGKGTTIEGPCEEKKGYHK